MSNYKSLYALRIYNQDLHQNEELSYDPAFNDEMWGDLALKLKLSSELGQKIVTCIFTMHHNLIKKLSVCDMCVDWCSVFFFQADSRNQTKWFPINQIKPNEFRKPQNSPNGHLVLYCYTANWILALHSHQRKNKPLMGVGFALLCFTLP